MFPCMVMVYSSSPSIIDLLFVPNWGLLILLSKHQTACARLSMLFVPRERFKKVLASPCGQSHLVHVISSHCICRWNQTCAVPCRAVPDGDKYICCYESNLRTNLATHYLPEKKVPWSSIVNVFNGVVTYKHKTVSCAKILLFLFTGTKQLWWFATSAFKYLILI